MIIYIRLIFITRGPVPSKAKILQLVTNLLAAHLRTKRELRSQRLGIPVSFADVTYTSEFSLFCSVSKINYMHTVSVNVCYYY